MEKPTAITQETEHDSYIRLINRWIEGFPEDKLRTLFIVIMHMK